MERGFNMGFKIIKNNDSSHVENILKSLKENDGYCPCMVNKDENTKCICKDFRNKMEDPDFYGLCHCGLYEKIKI